MHTGAELQMLHEGGWWPVKLLERRAANLRLNEPAAYRVAAIGYAVRRWAVRSELRPAAASSLAVPASQEATQAVTLAATPAATQAVDLPGACTA
eukprot:scaffold72805_cov63-Phaeocystis_antarctica.AAC.2